MIKIRYAWSDNRDFIWFNDEKDSISGDPITLHEFLEVLEHRKLIEFIAVDIETNGYWPNYPETWEEAIKQSKHSPPSEEDRESDWDVD